MQTWQNYYQNPAPAYQQNFNSVPYAPVQQRYPQMEQAYSQYGQQAPQIQQQIMELNGKVVDSADLITANDVPMDGNVAVFPKRDFSEIYAKSWKADGTIQTIVYKPVLETKESEAANTPHIDLSGLYEHMRSLREELAERFDRLEKSMTNSTNKSTTSRTKKEADS